MVKIGASKLYVAYANKDYSREHILQPNCKCCWTDSNVSLGYKYKDVCLREHFIDELIRIYNAKGVGVDRTRKLISVNLSEITHVKRKELASIGAWVYTINITNHVARYWKVRQSNNTMFYTSKALKYIKAQWYKLANVYKDYKIEFIHPKLTNGGVKYELVELVV